MEKIKPAQDSEPCCGKSVEKSPEAASIEEEKPFVKVYLNTEKVPLKFTRYRHKSHKHKMFMLTGLTNHRCNNCQKAINRMDTIFSCFRCDWDLCGNCWQLPSKREVPLAEDDKDVNETTITPVEIFVRTDEDDHNDDHEHDEKRTIRML
jgi:ribosomal protein L37AE/L43A